jgi:hypothetical protein
MSVYKRKGSPYYHFDFVRKGKRFHGSTGVSTLRAAEAYERKIREDAQAGRLDEGTDLTLDMAAARWWGEHGQFLRSSADAERRLFAAVKLVGKGKMLTEITTAALATAIQKRRGQLVHGRAVPSNATVNHAIVRAIRPILRTAAAGWGVKGLQAINWKALVLQEPKPTARDFTAPEWVAFMGALPDHWHEFATFMRDYGPRLGEMFFALHDVDIDGRRLRLRRRKAGDDHVIPLLQADAAMLAARITRARAAKLATAHAVGAPVQGPLHGRGQDHHAGAGSGAARTATVTARRCLPDPVIGHGASV